MSSFENKLLYGKNARHRGIQSSGYKPHASTTRTTSTTSRTSTSSAPQSKASAVNANNLAALRDLRNAVQSLIEDDWSTGVNLPSLAADLDSLVSAVETRLGSYKTYRKGSPISSATRQAVARGRVALASLNAEHEGLGVNVPRILAVVTQLDQVLTEMVGAADRAKANYEGRVHATLDIGRPARSARAELQRREDEWHQAIQRRRGY